MMYTAKQAVRNISCLLMLKLIQQVGNYHTVHLLLRELSMISRLLQSVEMMSLNQEKL